MNNYFIYNSVGKLIATATGESIDEVHLGAISQFFPEYPIFVVEA